MKHLKFLALAATLIAAATLTFSACSDDDDVDRNVTPESGLQVSSSVVNFDANGGTQSVTVTNPRSVSWTAVVSSDDSSWLSATQNGSSIDITVASNAGSMEGRMANIVINDVTVTVIQNLDQTIPAFWIDATSLEINGLGGELSIDTKSQAISSFIMSSSQTWVTSRQEGDTIYFTIAENTSVGRTATVTISTLETTSTHTVTIKQGKSFDLGYEPVYFENLMDYRFEGTPALFGDGPTPIIGKFSSDTNVDFTDAFGVSRTFDYLYTFSNIGNVGGYAEFPLTFYYSDVERGLAAVPYYYTTTLPYPSFTGYVRTAFYNGSTRTIVENYSLSWDSATMTFSMDPYNGTDLILGALIFDSDGDLRSAADEGYTNVTITLSTSASSAPTIKADRVNMEELGIPVLKTF